MLTSTLIIYGRIFRIIVVLGLSVVYIPKTSATDRFSIEMFSNEKICMPAGDKLLMDPFQTVRWMLSQVNVRDVALDINMDGDTLMEEKIKMLSSEAEIDECIDEGRCNDVDKMKLENLQRVLGRLLWAASNEEESIKSKLFRTTRLPVYGEFGVDVRINNSDEGSNQGSVSTLRRSEFLTLANRYVIVECIDDELFEKVLSTQSHADRNNKVNETRESFTKIDTEWLDTVLLRGSVCRPVQIRKKCILRHH